ncbi:DoxX family protein [Mucilaginibacter lappiensis]|uniref:DoxX family protein n=1 Tax=Mucilaginibacter lappiensis TaxID=354630 RepID=UPI003D1C4424
MINNIFSRSNKNYNNWAPLFLRLGMGFGFMAHGYAKLSRGPAGFEKLLHLIGVPFAHIIAYILPCSELFGGLALLLGLFVGLVSIPLISTMLVAMFTIQLKFGFSSVNTIGLTPQGPLFGPPGYEINVIYIAGLIALIISGAGVFSLDAFLMRNKKSN